MGDGRETEEGGWWCGDDPHVARCACALVGRVSFLLLFLLLLLFVFAYSCFPVIARL